MLTQLLNGNSGLLLILTLNNTDFESDLSLLSASVTGKKCDFSVKINLLNSKIKFSVHF